VSRSHRRSSPASLTGRGKVVAGALTSMLAVGGTLGYFALFPDQAPAFVRKAIATVGLAEEAPAEPPTCPLTGEQIAGGKVPRRPALAVKVENAPEARPQAALNEADVVVEEPVEGGYTRFIAIFHCGDSDRVGPVRSGRTTDPDYLRQFGRAVFGYAGGIAAVKREVPEAGLIDVNYILAADAYTRDPSRVSPHNLYTTTAALWRAGRESRRVPSPVFAYADDWDGRAKKLSSAHLPFSGVSDVWWSWSRRADAWLRSHGETPHRVEDGSPVSAANVVIQVVEVTSSGITDAAGNYSPRVELTGSGKVYVLRDGRVIAGRWERDRLDDVTVFTTRDGTEIALAPGRTWVELLPSSISAELTR
jgi:hypothetical protein